MKLNCKNQQQNMYRLNNLSKLRNQLKTLVLSVHNSSTATDTTKIVIPKRIDRSPTDILYTLSSTVGTDPTAAHYKFHDDPFLIPASDSKKYNYALAQEAGRKAAEWIREEHRDLFQVHFYRAFPLF